MAMLRVKAFERRHGAPVADWEREELIALKEAWPRTTLMRR